MLQFATTSAASESSKSALGGFGVFKVLVFRVEAYVIIRGHFTMSAKQRADALKMEHPSYSQGSSGLCPA